jgi:hypothetical protein
LARRKKEKAMKIRAGYINSINRLKNNPLANVPFARKNKDSTDHTVQKKLYERNAEELTHSQVKLLQIMKEN